MCVNSPDYKRIFCLGGLNVTLLCRIGVNVDDAFYYLKEVMVIC